MKKKNILKDYFGFCDFLHVRESYPLVKKTTQSSLGIILSILMILSWFGFLIYEIVNYEDNYTISFSQEFVENITNKIKVTFGFQIANESSADEILYKVYDSLNRTINYKFCNENFEEIRGDDIKNYNYNDIYRCFINYSIIITDQFNHFMKIHLINNGFKEKGRVPFKLKFKDPIIDHDSKNPFVENEKQPLELLFFFDTELQSFYRKYLKVVDYKTETFWHKNKNKNKITKYYLEDNEDSSRINAYNNTIYDGKFLGTFRFVLAKKKEVYTRKYAYYTDFLSKMGGYLSVLKSLFSILALLCVKPNDNIRIFNFLSTKKPSYFDNAEKTISEFYKNNDKKKEIDKFKYEELIPIKGVDKFCYLCYHYCCCKTICCFKKRKSKHLDDIDEYFNENITIDNYLEELIITKQKNNKIREIKNSEENNGIKIDDNYFSDNNFIEVEKVEYLIRAKSLDDEDRKRIEKEMSKMGKNEQNILNNINNIGSINSEEEDDENKNDKNKSLLDIDNKDS